MWLNTETLTARRLISQKRTSHQDKDKAVQCDLGNPKVHIKCKNVNYLDYRYLQNFVE